MAGALIDDEVVAIALVQRDDADPIGTSLNGMTLFSSMYRLLCLP